MKILAIDPGPKWCCYVILNGLRFVDFGIQEAESAPLFFAELARREGYAVAVEELTAIAVGGRLTTFAGCYETLETIGGIVTVCRLYGIEPLRINRNRHVMIAMFGTVDPSWERLLELGLATQDEVDDEWAKHLVKLRDGDTKKKEPRLYHDGCVSRWLKRNYVNYSAADTNFRLAVKHGDYGDRLSDLRSSLAIGIIAQRTDFLAERNELHEKNRAKASKTKARKKAKKKEGRTLRASVKPPEDSPFEK